MLTQSHCYEFNLYANSAIQWAKKHNVYDRTKSPVFIQAGRLLVRAGLGDLGSACEDGDCVRGVRPGDPGDRRMGILYRGASGVAGVSGRFDRAPPSSSTASLMVMNGSKWFRWRVRIFFDRVPSFLTSKTGVSGAGWRITIYGVSSHLSQSLWVPVKARALSKPEHGHQVRELQP